MADEAPQPRQAHTWRGCLSFTTGLGVGLLSLFLLCFLALLFLLLHHFRVPGPFNASLFWLAEGGEILIETALQAGFGSSTGRRFCFAQASGRMPVTCQKTFTCDHRDGARPLIRFTVIYPQDIFQPRLAIALEQPGNGSPMHFKQRISTR